MTAPRNPDRLVEAFLTEGQDELSDRAYDEVRSQIEHTRQRVVIGPWREPRMSTVSRFALAAAAVLVIAVMGIYLGPGQLMIGGPGPTPTASSSPSPSPSPRVLPLGGELEAGTYVMPTRFARQAFTFSVPAGWTTNADGLVEKNVEPGTSPLEHPADAALFAAFQVTHVYRDACNWGGTMTDAGTSPDELVNLLARQRGRETSTPRDVTVSGYPAQLVELVLPADLDVAECDEGFARLWPDVGGAENGGWPAVPGQTDRVYVLDVEGTRGVLLATTYSTPSDADLKELQGIVDSVRFEP